MDDDPLVGPDIARADALAAHDGVAADFLAAIVASSDDAIYSKDRDAVLTSWNRAAERLYGYAADEALGRPVSILIPDSRKGEEIEILHRILRGEHVDHYETQRQRKDGTLIDVSISVSPVHDAGGTIVEAAVIGRDITQQKQLEKTLEALRVEHQASSQKQALELNDEVVQGLAAAKLALESGQHEQGLKAIAETLTRAQRIVTRLLEQRTRPVRPGELIRDEAADV